MPQSFAALYAHLIFSTKERQPLIRPEFRVRLYDYAGGLCRERDTVLLAAGGTLDHIHLLVSLGRELALADLLRDLKANSSGWVHETFPGEAGFAWQAGYGAFSVSHSNCPAVKRHLAQQETHHRTTTFQEEFIAFLQRHEIEYDERYLWA